MIRYDSWGIVTQLVTHAITPISIMAGIMDSPWLNHGRCPILVPRLKFEVCTGRMAKVGVVEVKNWASPWLNRGSAMIPAIIRGLGVAQVGG